MMAGFFDIFRPFVREHLRHLRHVDVSTYLAVLVHADTEMKAWPTPATIAEITGGDLRSVQKSLARLTTVGYFRTMEHGKGGRGKSAVRYVTLPETPVKTTMVSKRTKHRSAGALNTGQKAQETPVRLTEPSTHELTNEQPNSNSRGNVAAAGGSSFETEEGKEGFALLRQKGVSSEKARELAGNLTGEVITRIVGGMKGNLRNPAGLAVKLCQDEIASGAITAELAAKIAAETQATQRRESEEAERQQRAAEEKRQQSAAAAAWVFTLTDEQIAAYRGAWLNEKWADPKTDATFGARLYAHRAALDQRMRAVRDAEKHREMAAAAAVVRKAREEKAAAEKREREVREASATAERDRERADWLDGQGDKLDAIVCAYFAKWPHEKLRYGHCIDPRKRPGLADALREVIATGRLVVQP